MICLNFLFVLLAMFICLMLCLDAMPSTFLAFVHLVYASFLCFGFWVRCRSRSSGLGLHPYTQVQQRVWISSFLHVCALFDLFHAFCVWIHACVLRSCFLHHCHASSVVFPLWVCVFAPLVPLCLFGCILSPFLVCLDVIMCGSTSSRCWLACRLPFSLFV